MLFDNEIGDDYTVNPLWTEQEKDKKKHGKKTRKRIQKPRKTPPVRTP